MQVVILAESTGDTVNPANERMLMACKMFALLFFLSFFLISLLKKKKRHNLPFNSHDKLIPPVSLQSSFSASWFFIEQFLLLL